MDDTNDLIFLLMLAFLWAYSLRAAWTGGIIYGWFRAAEMPVNPAGLAFSMIFWPYTLALGIAAKRREQDDAK